MSEALDAFARRARMTSVTIPPRALADALQAGLSSPQGGAAFQAALNAALEALTHDATITPAQANATVEALDLLLRPNPSLDAAPCKNTEATGILGRRVILPALSSLGLLAGGLASTATQTPEQRAVASAATFIFPDGGSTPLFAGFLRQVSATTPTYAPDMREALRAQLRERVLHVKKTEPALFEVLCAGGPLSGEYTVSAFARRSVKRLSVYLAAPLIAAALFREANIAPPLASVEMVVVDPTASLGNKNLLAAKRAREDKDG